METQFRGLLMALIRGSNDDDKDGRSLVGSRRADRIDGLDGDDNLLGRSGNDLLVGGRDDDDLRGGGGNDELRGQHGADVLRGGRGDDTLTGGKGADRFVIDDIASGLERIRDFDPTTGDVIDVRGALSGFTDDQPVENFVAVRAGAEGAIIAVDPDGRDGDFRDVAVLDGLAALTLDRLLDTKAILPADDRPLVLTPGLDRLRGTHADDIFQALDHGTLNSADVLDGRSGTDELQARLVAKDQTITPTLRSIEEVSLKVDAGGGALVFDAVNATSLQQIWLSQALSDRSGVVNSVYFDHVPNGTLVGIEGSHGVRPFEIRFDAVGGTADRATVILVGADLAGRGDFYLPGIEELEIVSTGPGPNRIGRLHAEAMDLEIIGPGDLVLADAFNLGGTVDASQMTGDLHIGGFRHFAVDVRGGSGDDRFDFSNRPLRPGHEVDGGAGVDLLVLSGLTLQEHAVLAAMRGLEALEVRAGPAVVDAAQVGLINHFAFSDVAGTAASEPAGSGAAGVDVSNVGADDTFRFLPGGASGGAGGAGGGRGGDGARFAPAANSANDTLNLVLDAEDGGNVLILGGRGGAGGGSGGDGVDASGFERVSLTSSGEAGVDRHVLAGGLPGENGAVGSSGVGLRLADAGTVVVTGGGDLEFRGIAGDDVTFDTAAYTGTLDVLGTPGPDRFSGGAAAEKLHGNGGDDLLSGGHGADAISGDSGNDVLSGGAGADTIHGHGGHDVVRGESGDDDLFGGAGRDRLDGGRGDDALDGGAGDDLLNGRFGNDQLEGGPGDDELRGVWDDDLFVFRPGFGNDVVHFFDDGGAFGKDLLDIRGMGYTEFSDVLANAFQDGEDTIINFPAGDSIRLAATAVASLSVDDLLLDPGGSVLV